MGLRLTVVLPLVFGMLGVHCLVAAADTPSPVERPTPLEWDQWQPQTDDSDSRLGVTVSVWEREAELEDLLTKLTQASGVSLTASDDLLRQHVVVFAKARTLSGIMFALARLYEGYWVYRRGQAPLERTYCLVEFVSSTAALNQWLPTSFRQITGQTVAERGESLKRRLDLYREALALKPEQVLARFEQADPWLCAEVLQPGTRPLLTLLCGFSDERKRQLTEQSIAVIPSGELDLSAQECLRGWETPRPGGTAWGWSDSTSDEDRAIYFGGTGSVPGGADARTVRVRWNGWSVALQLLTPDRTHNVHLVTMPDLEPPDDARRRLLDYGYGEATPERLAAIQAEGAVWEKAHEREDLSDLFDFSVVPRPNPGGPHMSAKVDLGTLGDQARPIPDLLAEAASQCQLAVISDAFAPGKTVSRSLGQTGEITVYDILDWLYCQCSATSRSYGEYLIVSADEPRLAQAGERASLEHWGQTHHPVAFALVHDLGEMIAALASSH